MIYDTQRPYIASYVLLRRNSDDKIAFVLRKNTAWMNDYWGLPSGKVEHVESYTAAAVREAKEEVGITIAEDNLVHAITAHRYDVSPSGDPMEWVDIYFLAAEWEGEPYNAEPELHGELGWFGMHDLPENTIPSVVAALRAFDSGEHYMQFGFTKDKDVA